MLIIYALFTTNNIIYILIDIPIILLMYVLPKKNLTTIFKTQLVLSKGLLKNIK
jgi:hypothetical protein